MSALLLASARLSKLRILCLNDLLDGDLRENIFFFSIFCLFFSGFQTSFYHIFDFTRIVASNEAIDYVTN